MPTVAAPSLAAQHHDARAASGAFLLDAGELCCSSAFMPGLSDLGASLHIKGVHHGHGRPLYEPDSVLLGGMTYSDELSGGLHHPHMGSSAAMQFLLLDDDEQDVPQQGSAPAASTAPQQQQQQHDMLRQHSAGHSSDAAQTSVAPLPHSSSLYCLAVVDEVTGLPLRPATPEETWEVERCFVLQEHCELMDAVLPPHEQVVPSLLPLPQYKPVQELQHFPQHPEAVQPFPVGLMDVGVVPELQLPAAEEAAAATPTTSGAVAVSTRGGSVEPQALEKGDQEELQTSRDEQRKAEQAAKRKGPNLPPNRRPDQPRRCGPCDNCGATESPQWRQGPPAKPLLCNACGMRFRRTNQLVAGETGASGNRAGARANKKPPAPAPAPVAEPEEQQQQQQIQVQEQQQQQRAKVVAKHTAAPMVGPDAKRPRRAAAVAAAATFAAAAIDVM